MSAQQNPNISAEPEIAEPSWSGLVERIRMGESDAMEELYRIFSTGVRFHLCRQLGAQDLDDRVHDVFLIIAQAIQRGDLREPERLMGYIRTIVRRQVAAHIESMVQARRMSIQSDGAYPIADHGPDPERVAIERQKNEVAMRVLHGIPERDREVLIRFYLREQPPDQICREMKLTETQFRLLKSRAKARFGELGRRRFSRRQGFVA